MFIADSKLILLLETFSDKEIREFKKLISSNFFTKGRNYLFLLNQLLKYKKKGFHELTLQKLYNILYPGKKFSIQTINNRFSELFKLAEEFLIYRTLKENRNERSKLLLFAYSKKNMSSLFEKQFRNSKAHMMTLQESDLKYLDISYIDNLNMKYYRGQKISENTFKDYYENSEYMTGIFMKNLFNFGTEFIQQEQTNRKYEFNFVNEILKRLDIDDSLIKDLNKKNSNIYRIVLMQFYFYSVFKSPENEKNYFEGRRIFDELKTFLDEDNKMELYRLMTSYCIMRVNQGIKKFEKELFKLYNEKLRLNIYRDSNNLFPVTNFRNYILLGIKMNKIRWTENFIKKYSKELPAENRDDEINLSYSKLFFSNKSYERSLNYLSGFKGLNYLHYCDSSILKLCNYFETEKYEEAFFEIDKFKHYLRNHKEIPKIHKEFSNNFLKVYQVLIRIKTNVDDNNIFVAENLMKKLKPVSRETWLNEKILELGIRN